MRRVALIGAGFIADSHLIALQARKGVGVSAVVDPSTERAEALAVKAGGARAFPSIEAMLEADRPDAAHVCTPPPLHRATAEPLLAAGVPVLLEKPMAETAADCEALIETAKAGGAALRINHNYVHHPAYRRLKRTIESGRYGKVRAVQLRFAVPLRQLEAKALGHWMFDSPRNLLLEQAVHPLSQLDDLLGPMELIAATPSEPATPAEGIAIANRWTLTLATPQAEAQVQLVLGASFPCWTISALCDDGVVEADLFEGRTLMRGSHAEIMPIDHARRSLSLGRQAMAQGIGGLGAYAAELLRIGGRSDGFNRAMIASVADFHDALDRGEAMTGETGLRLVRLCEAAASAAELPAPPVTPRPGENETFDVALLGGTGFIGQHLTEALLAQGKRVAVMARNVKNLPGVFRREGVGVFRGSITDPEAVADVVKRAPKVVNLAHGGAVGGRDAVVAAMVGGAEVVARACIDAGSERLLFVSSSAALYLGDKDATLDAATPPDQEPDERGDYSFAKVRAEEAMLALHRDEGLPVSILRPAVVVGEGGMPFHSALGAFNAETHCVGWNHGKNPLPFVLVEDVATAIIGALEADVDEVAGRSFNLVGDVRWSARDYMRELGEATGRPLRYHATSGVGMAGMEWLKFAAKKIAGRKGVQPPQRRDLRSRGMVSKIDTATEKDVLGWEPVADEARFRERAIDVHAG